MQAAIATHNLADSTPKSIVLVIIQQNIRPKAWSRVGHRGHLNTARSHGRLLRITESPVTGETPKTLGLSSGPMGMGTDM
jgi:hypothetical protein